MKPRHLFCLLFLLPALTAAAQDVTNTPERRNRADTLAQAVRDARQEVDLQAGSASQVTALQYAGIYDALARCDRLIAEYRIAPETDQPALLTRIEDAIADVRRLRSDLISRGALPVPNTPKA